MTGRDNNQLLEFLFKVGCSHKCGEFSELPVPTVIVPCLGMIWVKEHTSCFKLCKSMLYLSALETITYISVTLSGTYL